VILFLAIITIKQSLPEEKICLAFAIMMWRKI